MRISEKLDHLLRQYNYKRRRGSSSSTRSSNNLDLEEYLAQLDSYIDGAMQQIDKFLPKK